MRQPKGLFPFMAATLIFLILSALFIAEAQQGHSNISLGSSLTPTTNSLWLSRSGLYAFGFYKQGNGYAVGVFIAGIPEKTVVWTANRDDPPVPSNVTLALTSDGRLILQQPQGQVKDNYIADLSQPASAASMLDSGNFVIYNSSQEIVWQSFEHPTDTILAGQRLSAGQELFSSASETDHSTGIFRLKMQHDGHLVQYPVGTPDIAEYSYWASGTFGSGDNCTLNLDGDGHLYLRNSISAIIKNLAEGESQSPLEEKIYRMKLDVDGIFRVYSRALGQKGNWSTKWESSTDKCDPKGLCGLNGFCVLNHNKADCRCLPGFDFVNRGNWTSGCGSNFTAESCSIKYTMRALDNTRWEDAPYSVLQPITRKDCEEACLQDCNCEAALFKDLQCRKQRFPLRFGRKLQSDTNVAFIKVGTSAPIPKEVPPLPPSKETKKELTVDILIAGVSIIAFAFVVLAVSGVLIYRNHVWSYKRISEKGNVEFSEDTVAPRSFTFAELEQVTNGFKEELGRGSFGTVYKGIMPYNGKVVAVKRLEKVLTEGEREFQTEIKVIGRAHHRNLVRLIGYCLDGLNRLLVYDYMSNGTLADLLFTPENRQSWDERIGTALDIAKGILYLHEECETQIIHCDVKPQNILLDHHMRAKISDFGLAKLLKPGQTKTSTGIRGTRGYVAPEWHRKMPITVKADVYSFGVVLLEIICCRKSLDWSLCENEAVLDEWVYDCFEAKELGKLVGDEEAVDKNKLERMVKVGLWCIQDEPSLRPSMKKVMLMLEGTVDIPEPPSPTSFLSAI